VRSVYGLGTKPAEDPGISLDPYPHEDPQYMVVRYDGETKDTKFGLVLFEADRLLKDLWFGKDSLTGKDLQVPVFGYESMPSRYQRAGFRLPLAFDTKLWFVPEEIRIAKSADGVSMEFERVKMRALAHATLEGRPVVDPQLETFANHLTNCYQEYATHYPILQELQRLGQLTGVVKWIKENHIPFDLSLFREVQPTFVATPVTTSALCLDAQGDSSVLLHGGVSYRLDEHNYFQGIKQGVENIKDIALQTRPKDTDFLWEFQEGENSYCAVAQTLCHTPKPGGLYKRIVDMNIHVKGEKPLVLIRHYSSFQREDRGLGPGWDVVPSRLYFPGERFVFQAGDKNFQGYLSFLLQNEYGERSYFLMGANDQGYAVYKTAEQSGWIEEQHDGSFILQEADGSSCLFHASGCLQKEIDRFGIWIEYFYEKDQLVHILHKDGQDIRLFYEENHLQRAEGPGLLLSYHLDAQNLLMRVEDPQGLLYSHTYDEDRRLCTIENEMGFSILQASYDIYGRATLLQEGSFACRQAFDLHQGEEVISYGQNYQVQKTFTEDYRISKVEDSLQRSWELTYTDQHTMPSCITKPSGSKTRYEQDALGRLIGIYREDESVKHFWYDEKGRLFAMQQPDGSYMVTLYDDKNRAIGQITGPCVTREGDILLWRYDRNHCTLYEYEEDSSLIKSVIHSRGTDHYSYNERGECTLCEYADGSWHRMSYTTTGCLETEEDSTGFYCSYLHDTRGDISSISTPISTVEYVKQGSTGQYKDGLGHTTKYVFNEFNQIAEIIDAEGGRTLCFYDHSGHLEKLIFPNGSFRTMEYHKDHIRDR